MKRLLLSGLFIILLPCFAFSATVTPPAALKINPAVKKKIDTKKIKPGQLQKRPENAAMKILSLTFQTTSTGNWSFTYEVINPGLVNFPAGQLHYKAVQVLRNGNATRVPTLRLANRKGHPHGIKRSYNAPLHRCSLVSTLELEVSYKGKVLDKTSVRVPPMNVEITKAFASKGRYTAHLQNKTNYVTKVTVRTAARISAGGGTASPSSSLLSHVSEANTVKGPETIVAIPANSTKICTGTIVTEGEKPYLSVLFKDERKCVGKGYIILDSKILGSPSKADLAKQLPKGKISDKIKADIPEGAQHQPAQKLRPPEDY